MSGILWDPCHEAVVNMVFEDTVVFHNAHDQVRKVSRVLRVEGSVVDRTQTRRELVS